ncbi:cell division protein FtsQ/DivIB [Candidatus Pelagibacter sp.]|uniref:cell division protein FtsQ/DivIB n=1 Tax=Candidatus Pelagibacter sp. TaxID=2024849 RepID=UPI003F842A9B
MLQQINKKIIFYISLVIILGTFNNKNLKIFDLPKINMVNIEGIEFNDNEYLKIMNLIKLNNLLSIQKSQIKEILNSNNLIEEYEVFKKYPSSLEIKIEKTNFLASTNINGKNYLVGSNGKLINTKDYSQNLPFIFGNFETEKFLEFKNIILQTDFKYNNIKNFYYFPSGRWDIEMISGVLIKLPITGIKESLNLSIDLLEDIEFSNIKILDIRQKNQIVIND